MTVPAGQRSIAKAQTPQHRFNTGWLSGVLYSIPVVVLYLFVLLLMRIAPESALAAPDEVEPSEKQGARGIAVIEASVFVYRRSLVRRHLHRQGARCLFLPSCSEFALRCGRKFGLWKALLVIGDRFRRCRADYQGDFVDFP